MPKAAPVAPLGLCARQCHADADVETAATIAAPANKAMKKRLIWPSFRILGGQNHIIKGRDDPDLGMGYGKARQGTSWQR
jgi:hypothetical protein